ncbi:co-chaperone GroES [Candidatus Phytoplasma sacchari]|nr:co-chaperone GroES [Candidatus Phytoplasma sacchari]KAB8122143.1 co-chaperone GroES [Candidatus Phytoplasma sacchari]
MVKKIKPLNDYVVLKCKKIQNKTSEGIILSVEEKKEESVGIVNNLGPKVKEIQINDEVIYKNYSGTKFKDEYENEEYLIIKQEDILAIIEK